MNIDRNHFYQFLERTCNAFFLVNEKERIVYVSPAFSNLNKHEKSTFVNKKLNNILVKESLFGIQNAIKQIDKSLSVDDVLWQTHSLVEPLYLKGTFIQTTEGMLFLFRVKNKENPDTFIKTHWQEAERAKELACLYEVADWIRASQTVDDFFIQLPTYIFKGMQFPDNVRVFSEYRGRQYGERPVSQDSVTSHIVVRDVVCGQISVGYDNPNYKMLVEEQKLINEITKILGLTLERKELKENLAIKTEEVDDLAAKINNRSVELNEQRKKLDTLNKYTKFVQRDFDDAKNRINTIFKAIPDLMAIIDLKRNVIMTNQENVLSGNKCYKTFFNSEAPCVDCRLKRVIQEKAPVTLEVKHKEKHYEVHALPIFNKQNEVEGVLEFYRDISYKKNFEKQLQQADKLASLGQLVSGIGHEINNPNQFIRGNINIVKQAMEDILPIIDEYAKKHPDLKIARLKYDFFREHIMTLVNDIFQGSERIKRIVKDLKGFARKDDGLLVDQVDINTVITESVRLVHNQVHSQAQVELILADNIPTIKGNAQKIEQVIINLVINAGQAMTGDKKGVITIITKLVKEQIVIQVKDTGKGMTESTASNIFDPFFTTKRAKGGTGLGLSIAYRIIEEHDGQISVDSRLGEGTCFTITIPVQERAEESL